MAWFQRRTLPLHQFHWCKLHEYKLVLWPLILSFLNLRLHQLNDDMRIILLKFLGRPYQIVTRRYVINFNALPCSSTLVINQRGESLTLDLIREGFRGLGQVAWRRLSSGAVALKSNLKASPNIRRLCSTTLQYHGPVAPTSPGPSGSSVVTMDRC